MGRKAQGNICLTITAIVWGVAFIFQTVGLRYVEPFTLNGVRMVLGGAVLIPVIVIMRKLTPGEKRLPEEEQKRLDRKTVMLGSVCGVILCTATMLQSFGLKTTSAGKAAFITTFYIVLVPLFGLLFGKRVSWVKWLCIFTAIFGLFLLCIKGNNRINTGDLLILICAFCFALHIFLIDRYSEEHMDGLLISCVQFFVSGIICLVCMFIFEHPTFHGIRLAGVSILYSGAVSCGVGYTLQIVGQQKTDSTMATLIMGMESVVAALAGWLFLNQKLSLRELIGCALVLAAVIVAGLDGNKKEISV